MVVNKDKLLEDAKGVLKKNWMGRFTIPSPVLYPHQWSWDSAFIAMGNSYFNTDRAIKELESLFDAQWKNGMVPHIVFNEKNTGNKKEQEQKKKITYFPTADFYDSNVSENAPDHVRTSGMTQPPVHAIACYYIYKNAAEKKDKEKAKSFLKDIYPKLMNFHNFLLTSRDPEKSGLVTIFHPWESGLDNLPVWDEPVSRINIDHGEIPKFKRLDIVAVGGAKKTRTDDHTYAKFIYLAELMKKKYNYDEDRMYSSFPFKVKDIVFSSILYVANKYMLKIADVLGQDDEDGTHQIREWMSRTEQNFYKYFTPTQKLETIDADDLYDYDLIKRGWIRKRTISSLVPIYTELIPKEKINVLVKWINDAHYCGADNCHVPVLPSTDLDEEYFKPENYWQGPIWVNVNWMIYLGLIKYGYLERGEQIRDGIFELAQNHGFREYYDPFTGQGLGGTDFSWTAALVIDMLLNKRQ